jgi:hypothetical protein
MKYLIVAAFDAEDALVQQIRSLLRGTELRPELIGQQLNMQAIKTHFKVSELELRSSSLLTALVSRIAVNDV